MGKKKKRSLTPRQNHFAKALAHGRSQKQAAIEAGYSPKNARQSGYQVAQQIRDTMADALERHGLTDDTLIDKYLLPALEAEETVHIVTGGVKKQRIHAKKRPLWHARLRGLDIAFMLKGSYAPLKVDTQE
jgi:phage terminase small subunit